MVAVGVVTPSVTRWLGLSVVAHKRHKNSDYVLSIAVVRPFERAVAQHKEHLTRNCLLDMGLPVELEMRLLPMLLALNIVLNIDSSMVPVVQHLKPLAAIGMTSAHYTPNMVGNNCNSCNNCNAD